MTGTDSEAEIHVENPYTDATANWWADFMFGASAKEVETTKTKADEKKTAGADDINTIDESDENKDADDMNHIRDQGSKGEGPCPEFNGSSMVGDVKKLEKKEVGETNVVAGSAAQCSGGGDGLTAWTEARKYCDACYRQESRPRQFKKCQK